MKKRYITLMLTAGLALSMMGCGAKSEPAPQATTETSEAAQEASQEAASEASQDAPAQADGAESTESGSVMTHADFIAADVDSEVTVETYVQAKQGWWENNGVGNATFYTQAEDGAYFIYNMPCSQEEYDKLEQGTKIKVTGYKSEWSGEVEIIDATFDIVEGNYVADAFDVTSMLSDSALIDHQNEFVSFKGMTIEASKDAEGKEAAFLYNYDGSGSEGDDLYFNASVDGNTYTFTIESYLCGKDTDVYKAVQNLKVGDTVDMEGFLYWYEGANPHITSVSVK
ncbi:MAG: hypothetical protein K6E91_05000 [Butyrivibrio sp.]|nr:hypothetical protein [Butyrivibrio sp.]